MSIIYKTLVAGALMLGLAGCQESQNGDISNTKYASQTLASFAAKGYKVCELGTSDNCFACPVSLADMEKARITPSDANPLAFRDAADLVGLKNNGCDLKEYPKIVDKLGGSINALKILRNSPVEILADAVCAHKFNMDILLEYDSRFRESYVDGIVPALHFLSILGKNAAEVNCYSADLTAAGVYDLIDAKIDCETEQQYAKLRQMGIVNLGGIACNRLTFAIENGLTPQTIEWYLQLGKQNPLLSIDLCDMDKFEEAIKREETTRAEIAKLARTESERLNEENLRKLLH